MGKKKKKKSNKKLLKNINISNLAAIKIDLKGVNIHRKVIKKDGVVTGKTETLNKKVKIKSDVKIKVKGDTLEKQYNYLRKKYIDNLKESEYAIYTSKVKKLGAIPLAKNEWWKTKRKDYIIPKTAKRIYTEGYTSYTNEFYEDGTPKKKNIKGVVALRKQVLTLAKADKQYKKWSFLNVYEHYGKQTCGGNIEALKIFNKIMSILWSLSPDEINFLIEEGAIRIEELYNPNELAEFLNTVLLAIGIKLREFKDVK